MRAVAVAEKVAIWVCVVAVVASLFVSAFGVAALAVECSAQAHASPEQQQL